MKVNPVTRYAIKIAHFLCACIGWCVALGIFGVWFFGLAEGVLLYFAEALNYGSAVVFIALMTAIAAVFVQFVQKMGD